MTQDNWGDENLPKYQYKLNKKPKNMKKNLRYFMTLLLMMVASVGWADEESVTFSEKNYTNGQEISSYEGTNFSVTFDKGTNSNAPKYYTSGTAIRVYGGNTFTVSSDNTITDITLTFSSGEGTNAITADNGTYSDKTWTGSAKSVTFTVQGTTGHRRIAGIAVKYTTGGTSPCAKPTFSPAGGTYSTAQSVTLSTSTEGATIYYTIDGNDPTTNSNVYSVAIDVSANTTIKAFAAKDGYNDSEVAEATYTITQPKSISEVRAQGTGDVFTKGIVTSCSGTTGYIQDNGAAICVFGASLNVGDEVTVHGTLSTFNGLLEITQPEVVVLSNGNTVDPTVKTIAEINEDYANNNTLQGWLVKIEDATVTAINNQNTTISQDGNTIVVRNIDSSAEVAVGDIITLVGNIGCYNGAQIANPTDISKVSTGAPTINAEDVELAYNATSGEIAYTIDNPVDGVNLTASCTAEWISNITVESDKVTFTIPTTNEGTEPRTATVTLSYNGAEDKVVTVTQGVYVVDFATLPFEFDEGISAIEGTTGLTQEGLGTDYSSSPKLKFDNTGDYLILKINEEPGILTFDIKGNGFSGGTFTVQTSKDGSTYTELKSYTELSNTQSESIELNSDVRYVKWIYTSKSSGNVALGNIALAKPSNEGIITVAERNLDFDADEHNGTIVVEYTNIKAETAEIQFVDAVGETATYDWLTAELNSDKNINYNVSENTGEARTAYIKVYGVDNEDNDKYSALITITQAAPVIVGTDKYELVSDASSLADGDNIIIVKSDGTKGLSTTQNNNNRAAADVNKNNDDTITPTSEIEIITLEGNPQGWYLKVSGGYLYAASSSSNYLRTEENADDNAKAAITITDGSASIIFQGTNTRNVLRYNSGSDIFSCYGSASQSPVSIYKKVSDTPAKVHIKTATSGYTTLVSGEALDIVNLPDGLTAYYVTADGVSTEKVTLTKVTAAVPAETPLIFKGAVSTPYEIQIATGETTPLEGNKLAGYSYQPTNLTLNSAYILSGGEFHPTNAGTFPAGKAYLAVAVPTPSEAKNLTIVFGEGTGINNVNVNENESGKIFNLAGQQMKSAVKGVYIKNGRKYVK